MKKSIKSNNHNSRSNYDHKEAKRITEEARKLILAVTTIALKETSQDKKLSNGNI